MDHNDPTFTPPHCAYRECGAFSGKNLPKNWYYLDGFHNTVAHGKVQRYFCNLCERTFSRQTFDLHYYEKRRIPWESITKAAVGCTSDRALARELNFSPTTVAKKLSRYARWAMMQQQSTLATQELVENLAADGFESFTVSQYFPCHINLLAGVNSQFAYTWDLGFLRRKGSMTPSQKRKRSLIEQTWEAYKGDLRRSFTRAVVHPLLSFVERRNQIPTMLFTDQHPEYPKALHHCVELVIHSEKLSYVHSTVSSKLRRDKHNPLFSVNYLDRELRKDLANHVRETTRFSREPNMLMDRVTVCLFLHNFAKRYRIKSRKSDLTTHANVAGIEEERNPVLVKTREKFLRRPWRPAPEDTSQQTAEHTSRDTPVDKAARGKTGWEATVERQWRREIPRPKGVPKIIQAGFWLK